MNTYEKDQILKALKDHNNAYPITIQIHGTKDKSNFITLNLETIETLKEALKTY